MSAEIRRTTEPNSRRIEALFRTLRLIEADVSLPLALTLVAVAREPGLSVNELAQRIDAPQQTASRYAAILQGRYESLEAESDKFARNPLLSLEVNAQDPRRRALYLTAPGKKWLARILKMEQEPTS
jgi:DNA-binding MarR family transcriptional regulator